MGQFNKIHCEHLSISCISIQMCMWRLYVELNGLTNHLLRLTQLGVKLPSCDLKVPPTCVAHPKAHLKLWRDTRSDRLITLFLFAQLFLPFSVPFLFVRSCLFGTHCPLAVKSNGIYFWRLGSAEIWASSRWRDYILCFRLLSFRMCCVLQFRFVHRVWSVAVFMYDMW